MAVLQLTDAVAALYAGALHAIARADGELTPDEASHLQALVAARAGATVDPEELFFDRTTAESFAAALRAGPHRAAVDPRDVGLALVADAVALAIVDGDINGKEGHAILRFAHALGCTAADVHAITDQLDEWLAELG